MPITQPQIGFDQIQLNGSIRDVNINSLYDDMESGVALNGLWLTSGTVTALPANNAANHPGIYALASVGAGSGSQITGAGNAFPVPSAFYTQTWLVNFPVLSDGVNTYVAQLGLLANIAPAAPTDGVFFTYSSAAQATWLVSAEKASVTTSVDSGVTVNAGQWYQLRVKANGIAAPAQFFIDGVLVATIATNLPTVVLNHSALIRGTVGVVSRNMLLDYMAFQYAFSSAR
jgi:hypothetical protein